MSFYYLASPYSKYVGGIEAAYQHVCAQAALLVSCGVPVYSPIAATHGIAVHGGLDPLDHGIWLDADETFMQAARGLIVCEMEGWESSYGVQYEIDAFRGMGKPIIHMTPGHIPHCLLPGRRKVIGLCGYAGAGKDAAAQGLTSMGWTRVAFADPLRQALLNLNPTVHCVGTGQRTRLSEAVAEHGWDKCKSWPEVRQLLQRLGTEAGRNIHGPDCWVSIARRKIDGLSGNVVITDVRFLNEVNLIRELGGMVIRIERHGVGPVNSHVSDVMPFEPDEVITNDGSVAELHSKIQALALPQELRQCA